MPSTTFHFPEPVLARIDEAAVRLGLSRNRFVILACERALEEDAGAWPDDIFQPGLSAEDQELLTDATRELEAAVQANRRSRGAPLL